MKKLMIAAAIVCAAAMSQAAELKWNYSFSSGDPIYAGYTVDKTGTATTTVGKDLVAYIIAYDATTMNQDTILSGLRDGKTIEKIAGTSLIKSSTTGEDSKIKTVEWSVMSETAPATLSLMEVILSADKSYAYVSAKSDFVAKQDPLVSEIYWSTSTTKKNRDPDGTANFGSGGWYAVPEPTSGLLLLLGVGALALRRRRA